MAQSKRKVVPHPYKKCKKCSRAMAKRTIGSLCSNCEGIF